MRSIRDAKMFGEPVLQVVQTQTINNVQVRTFELLIPLKLEGDAADTAGGKS